MAERKDVAALRVQLQGLPVHGPDGRVAVVRQALGLRQVDFAKAIRDAGGRASRETVSHWENIDEEGRPRARLTRRNAEAVSRLVRDELGLDMGEQWFYEPSETALSGLERRQLEMHQLLAEALARLEELHTGMEELQEDRAAAERALKKSRPSGRKR